MHLYNQGLTIKSAKQTPIYHNHFDLLSQPLSSQKKSQQVHITVFLGLTV